MDLKLVYDNPYQLVEELIHYIEYHDPILQNIKGTSDNLFYFNRVKDILYIYIQGTPHNVKLVESASNSGEFIFSIDSTYSFVGCFLFIYANKVITIDNTPYIVKYSEHTPKHFPKHSLYSI